MDAEQRDYLARRFIGFLEDVKTDHGPDGRLGPETVCLIGCLEPMIAWLRDEASDPGPGARQFLEERLEGFKDSTDYEAIAYEHDALMAALEACD